MDPATKKLATAGDTPPVEGAAASSAAASMEAERSAPLEEPQTPPPEYDWQTTGHEWLGVWVARPFGRSTAIGQITKWVPPDDEDGALFHVEHLDGDEEDLEVYEVEEALERYKTTGHCRQEAKKKENKAAAAAKAEARASDKAAKAAAAATAKAEKEAAKKREREEKEAEKEAKRQAKQEKAAAKEAAAEAKAARPTKPKTAWHFFSAQRRDGIVNALKEEDREAWDAGRVTQADGNKRVSEAWKTLPKEERAEFEAQAAADKRRYEEECAAAGIEPDYAGPGRKKKGEGEPLQPIGVQGLLEAEQKKAAEKEEQPKPEKEKRKTPKQLAKTRLDEAVRRGRPAPRPR